MAQQTMPFSLYYGYALCVSAIASRAYSTSDDGRLIVYATAMHHFLNQDDIRKLALGMRDDILRSSMWCAYPYNYTNFRMFFPEVKELDDQGVLVCEANLRFWGIISDKPCDRHGIYECLLDGWAACRYPHIGDSGKIEFGLVSVDRIKHDKTT